MFGRFLAFIFKRLDISPSYTLPASLIFQILSIVSLYIALIRPTFSNLPEYFFSGFLLVSVLLFETAKVQQKEIMLKDFLQKLFDLPVNVALTLLLPAAIVIPSIMGFIPAKELYYLMLGLIIIGSFLPKGIILYSPGRMVVLALFAIYGVYNGSFEMLLLAYFILFAVVSGLRLMYILVKILESYYVFSRIKSVFLHVMNFTSLIFNRNLLKRKNVEGRKVKVSQPQEEGYSFMAVVLDKEDNPVRGAEVTLFNSEQMLKEFNITGGDGKCSFDGLEDGEYIISIKARGYEPEEHRRYIGFSTGEVFKITTKKENTQEEEPASMEDDIFSGESALIEYSSSEELGIIVKAIVKEHIANDRNVFLAAMPPRSYQYRKEFEGYIKEGKVRIINLPPRGALPESDRNIQEVPMTNLEYFRAVMEEMPAGSLLIFEPLSSLIINLGKNPAYQFILKVVDYLSKEGIFFVTFINKETSEEASMFRELFVAVAEISGGRLRRIT
ncbi:hypothetical protein BMS3Bbin15_01263 [archaeon BMS3Bbin15]|nr:hypothetical protein BMS3Bbin15_01263 [archaeon BMS3Bbin15]